MVRDARPCRAPHHEGLRPHPEEPAAAGVSKPHPEERRLRRLSKDTAPALENALRGSALSCQPQQSHIRPMAKKPGNPKKPVKTPKSKAHRPDVQPIGPALAELLNPAINRGDAGLGSGTGLQPPPDNSRDRRAGGGPAAQRARASTPKEFPQDTTRPMPLRPNPQSPGARASESGGF